MYTVFFSQFQQPGNWALVASLAVVDVIGEPDGAAARLQTVRHQKKYFVGRIRLALAEDQLVVDLDERVPDPLLGNTKRAAKQCHQGQKKLNR